MLYTLLDARNHVAKFVESGTCPNLQVVKDRINEACRRLMHKANWSGTVARLRFATYNNTITLPRGALAVLDVDIDLSPRRVFGGSYEFLENGPGELQPLDGYGKDLLDLGDGYPTFFDIPTGQNCQLVAFSTAREDIGKQLTLWGYKDHNMEVLTNGVPGETLTIGWWKGGVEGSIQLNTMPTLSVSSYNQITAVQKPVTVGYISLYTYLPPATPSVAEDNRMYFLAKYHPEETQPGYRRYRITMPDTDNGSNVLCRVKMRFEPLSHDTDILPIQNIDALKAAVIAIREENDKNGASAKEYWTSAISMLNDQLSDSKDGAEPTLQVTDQFALAGNANII
jgi:hypothetical protein